MNRREKREQRGWLTDFTENIAFEYGLSPRVVKSIVLTESNGDPQKFLPEEP